MPPIIISIRCSILILSYAHDNFNNFCLLCTTISSKHSSLLHRPVPHLNPNTLDFRQANLLVSRLAVLAFKKGNTRIEKTMEVIFGTILTIPQKMPWGFLAVISTSVGQPLLLSPPAKRLEHILPLYHYFLHGLSLSALFHPSFLLYTRAQYTVNI